MNSSGVCVVYGEAVEDSEIRLDAGDDENAMSLPELIVADVGVFSSELSS